MGAGQQNRTGDDPVLLDPLTGPEELGHHGRAVAFHDVERERHPCGLIGLRERRVELFRPWVACDDAGTERDVGNRKSTNAGVGGSARSSRIGGSGGSRYEVQPVLAFTAPTR